MRLNQASDFALRILMMLAAENQPLTVDEIAREQRLVKSHLMKIVAKLVNAGVLQSIRGRNGGVVLARSARDISVGEVVRSIEADFAIVECMREGQSDCAFMPRCRLRGTMADARDAFMKVLDEQDLASLIA